MVEASVAVPEPGGGARRRGRQVRSGARARCGLAVRLQTWTTNGGRGKAVLAEAANWAEEFGTVACLIGETGAGCAMCLFTRLLTVLVVLLTEQFELSSYFA